MAITQFHYGLSGRRYGNFSAKSGGGGGGTSTTSSLLLLGCG